MSENGNESEPAFDHQRAWQAYDKSEYGEERRNKSLAGFFISAFDDEVLFSDPQLDDSVINEEDRRKLREHLMICREAFGAAIRERDSQFFRSIAGGLDQVRERKINLDPKSFVYPCYSLLCAHLKQQGDRRFPTKKEVKDAVLRAWALARITGDRNAFYWDACFPDSKPADEEKIRKEITFLPEQKWNRLLKAFRLEKLLEAKPGPKSPSS